MAQVTFGLGRLKVLLTTTLIKQALQSVILLFSDVMLVGFMVLWWHFMQTNASIEMMGIIHGNELTAGYKSVSISYITLCKT